MSKLAKPAFAIVCIVSWANLAACNQDQSAKVEGQSQAPAMAAAAFRYVARETYEAARSRSCEAPFMDYASALDDQIMAVRAFESQNRLTAAGFNLSLARADTDLNQDSCWADDDPRFAARHLAMAKEDLDRGLDALSELAPLLTREVPADGLSGAISAAFRAQIVPLIEAVKPLCRLSNDIDNEQITAPATARLADFKRQISDTAYSLHYAVAEDDVLYRQSIVVVDCAPPLSGDAGTISLELEEDVTSRINTIQRQFPING